jgi:hypothetical protein
MSDKIRREWCMAVARLVYPLDPDRCVKTLVGYLPMMRDLPDAAFSPASAEEVALHDRRMAFPSYDEIANPLRAWWRQNKPYQPQISGPQTHIPERPRVNSPEEIAAVSAKAAAYVAEVKAKEAATRPGRVEPRYLTPDQLRLAYAEAAKMGAIVPPWIEREAGA